MGSWGTCRGRLIYRNHDHISQKEKKIREDTTIQVYLTHNSTHFSSHELKVNSKEEEGELRHEGSESKRSSLEIGVFFLSSYFLLV